ncbi:MAG TPA: preprotein translocase subunit SecG [Caulobacteraceae bacterium]|jgi:preprotein translocase subunit SecG
MLSGLLITLDILVCIALIAIVLMQRSEGGAFGMGGGPTGLITARGAGDLLTRTTWVLFTLFLVLSLSLTLLGAHDRATSSVINQLKLQKINPNAVQQQPAAPPPQPTAPLTSAPSPTAPLFGPAAQAPLTLPGAQPAAPPASVRPANVPPAASPAAKTPAKHAHAAKPAAAPTASQSAQPAPPVLEPPAPKPAPTQP